MACSSFLTMSGVPYEMLTVHGIMPSFTCLLCRLWHPATCRLPCQQRPFGSSFGTMKVDYLYKKLRSVRIRRIQFVWCNSLIQYLWSNLVSLNGTRLRNHSLHAGVRILFSWTLTCATAVVRRSPLSPLLSHGSHTDVSHVTRACHYMVIGQSN